MIQDEHLYRGKLYSFSRDFRHALGRATVPLIASELTNIAHEMPVLFAKTEASWSVVGLLADPCLRHPLLGPGGEWNGGYSPFHLRIHPFQPVAAGLGWECDPARLVSAPGRGRPFFLEDGQRAPEYAKVLEMLADADRGAQTLTRLSDVLAASGLLVPLALAFELAVVTPTASALFCVDALRLARLSPADLARLVAGSPSALDLAFASVYSLRVVNGAYASPSERDLDARIAALIHDAQEAVHDTPPAVEGDHAGEPVLLRGFSLDQSSSIDFAGLA
ncbi:MAG: SapC family protein [Alsobacter sp.]